MIYTGLNRTGEIETVKANGSADVAEVYGGIGESDPIYYKQREMVGTSPMQFKALGISLKDYRIYGETLQDGTPSPDMPVDVVGCGVWDETQQSYKLPLTVNGTEYPIYLGQVETTRKIKKLVFDGTEEWQTYGQVPNTYRLSIINIQSIGNPAICSHFVNSSISEIASGKFTVGSTWMYIRYTDVADLADSKSYLAAQYAAGTPVTVWYVLSEPETGIVNEPLMKIGDYADTISMAQAGVTIPTTSGANVLDMTSIVKPSAVSITGNIKPTGYGQLLDVNDVDIRDSNSTPIFIRG